MKWRDRCHSSEDGRETVCGRLLFIGEDGFDGAVEEASEFEGKRETGVELAGLDGVDGLPRDLETFG